jgi:hypothetical protein
MEVDLLAELARLRFLVWASFWASVALVIAWVAAIFWLLRKVAADGNVIRAYPWKLRLRILCSPGSNWEAVVEKAHLDRLRARRRTGKYLFVVSLIAIVMDLALGALVRDLEGRIRAKRDRPPSNEADARVTLAMIEA